MLLFAFHLFAACSVSLAHAAKEMPVPPERFSIEVIARRLESNRPTSMETLLQELPVSFRRNPVLLRESRSTQHASPTSPRVILSNDDGSFVAAFNGDRYAGGGEKIEWIQFHEKSARFEFGEIDFSTETPKLVRNAQNCAGCHGSPGDPRPNWESFPKWPGAYGENAEKLSAAESTDLRSFIDRAKSHPRYRALLDLATTHLPTSSGLEMPGRPNSRMNENLHRLNARRVARLVRENTNYLKDRFGFAAALLCPTDDAARFAADYFPDRSRADLPDSFRPFEIESRSTESSAFFWAVAPRNEKRFSWTLSFGDMMNVSAVRTRGSASRLYLDALLAGDPELSKSVSEGCDRLRDRAQRSE